MRDYDKQLIKHVEDCMNAINPAMFGNRIWVGVQPPESVQYNPSHGAAILMTFGGGGVAHANSRNSVVRLRIYAPNRATLQAALIQASHLHETRSADIQYMRQAVQWQDFDDETNWRAKLGIFDCFTTT